MAVMTYTRRQVVDMFPEYLSKRGAPLVPMVEAYANELGIARLPLVQLFNGWMLRDGDEVPRDRFIFRAPYALKWPALDVAWAALVQAGLAERTAGGWRITPRGDDAVLEYQRRFRAGLRELALPTEPTRRAAAEMERLASRIPTTALRASWAKRRPRPPASEGRSDILTVDLAALELWNFRDDCHIGSWETAGHEGPAFEVLSFVWSSPTDVSWTKLPAVDSVERLAKALESRQDRADIERNVDALVRRGDLAREDGAVRITPEGQRRRDAIEEETDRRYFVIWDLDDAQTARLGDDLRSIVDALPTG